MCIRDRDTDAAFCYSMNGYTFSNHLYSDFLSVNPKLSSYLVNSKAVSYTHLDVYKRQIQKSQFVVGIAQVLVILTPLMQHPLLNGSPPPGGRPPRGPPPGWLPAPPGRGWGFPDIPAHKIVLGRVFRQKKLIFE